MLHNQPAAYDLQALFQPAARVADFARHTQLWHDAEPRTASELDLPLQLHFANFQLWHLEDRARDPHATDATIAAVKRSIDGTNQRRNDLVEQLDQHLLDALSASGLPHPSAPLHSETPGMIVDRLSILSLKLFHTAEEKSRADASESHRNRNLQRLAVLQQQNDDLADCLRLLWEDVCQGRRRFQLYRQMKMYNDPELNPILYASAVKPTSRGGA